ncbi:Nucleoside-diphosphate-sugar epimerase [Treponema bryantii]|uniref:Nucleoside-diphosphate-sugar epimerase n=1 Tax=Treponema bryantii TaxID=163 RepID=A0A1I3IWQ8_9SPIR|nr:NAD(P)-dependent oxidoreductase [Treponema bryantii]SFI52399.1 Nucleoside-diphosphate-sugar epimerase [Treponema bryantii]
MKRIIITGATGMIGSAIVREAIKSNYEITCLVRKDSNRIKNIIESSQVKIVNCNITDYSKIKLKDKYDIFIHLAWDKTSVGGRDDVDCQLKNIQYTLDAVRLAYNCGCSVFIGAGSQAEYGVQKVPLTPNLPVNPESGYGIAKYTAGKLSQMLCMQLGIHFNWMRILSVYGPNDGTNTLISYVVRELKEGRSPQLTKCEQKWDYLHCNDAARAFLAVSESGIDGKFYPLGSGSGRILKEYINDIKEALKSDIPVSFGAKEYYPHQPMYLVADTQELENDTKWKPLIAFQDGIKTL